MAFGRLFPTVLQGTDGKLEARGLKRLNIQVRKWLIPNRLFSSCLDKLDYQFQIL